MAFERGSGRRGAFSHQLEHRKKPTERAPWTLVTVEEFLKRPSIERYLMARDSAYHWLIRGITSHSFSPRDRAKALEILGRGIEADDIRDGVKYAMDKSPSFFESLRLKFQVRS